MSDISLSQFTREPLSYPWRWLAAGSIAVAAAAHIPVIGPHLDEAPYMGALFILLTAACTVLAGAILIRDTPAVYALVVLTCGLAVVGYVATRVVAFPMLNDDVGNWLEPLGVVSIVSESIAVAIALTALLRTSQPATRQVRTRSEGVSR